ncbi:MAG: UbiD family decarboxylase, partial [Thermoplasmata archaeon]|nr:UbiD family decarboxylase [Thermoplasmata archaeon]
NMEEVEWAIATRFQGDRDMIVYENVRGSSLDPSSYEGHLTTKLGLDATKPLKGREKFKRYI